MTTLQTAARKRIARHPPLPYPPGTRTGGRRASGTAELGGDYARGTGAAAVRIPTRGMAAGQHGADQGRRRAGSAWPRPDLLPNAVTPHILRRIFGSLCFFAARDLRCVMGQLRHDDLG